MLRQLTLPVTYHTGCLCCVGAGAEAVHLPVQGNLSEFVKQKPEAQSYYQLDATPISFKLPEPGYLEGIKSKDRAILKMSKVLPCYSENLTGSQDLQLQLDLPT